MTAPAPIPLPDDRLRTLAASLPGWRVEGGALLRTYRFAGFREALAFMLDCAEDIERLDHHPEWTNLYDRVTVRLTTHDAGDRITALDVELAKVLDWVAERFA